MQQATVLFDGDCGFCRWSADRLRRWDRRGALRFATLRSVEADAALRDMDQETRFGAWHIATPEGRVRSGGAAIPEVLRRLPAGRPLAWVASLSPDLTDRAYRLVARHRMRLGRALGQRACSVDPTRLGR